MCDVSTCVYRLGVGGGGGVGIPDHDLWQGPVI